MGSAWAGVGLAPVPGGKSGGASDTGTSTAGGSVGGVTAPGGGLQALQVGSGADLGLDEALVGAAKISLYPQPDASKGEVWVRDKAKCLPAGTKGINPAGAQEHAADWRSPWIENTNCLYMGGFGVGPSQPIIEWDEEYGLWVRTVAVTRGGKTLVLSLLDAEGYNGLFNKMCPPEKACGAIDIGQQMAAEIPGLEASGIVIASTHAHSAMDLIGGWGGVPPWYMRQVAESIRQSIRDAVAAQVPARIEAGDVIARQNNGERRLHYYSAEDPSLNWFRAVGRDGGVVATVGTFAAHATSFGSSAIKAHADWPGVFAKRTEEKFGGMAVVFEAGLGNMSARGNNTGSMGGTLANLLPPVGAGKPVPAPNVRHAQEFWDQPVTNGPLGTLGAGGFFDRRFQATPAVVEVAKPDESQVPCRSASAVSVRTQVSAAKIGDMVITAAPGEVFSNYTNTLEERSPITSLAIGQANDPLGYMPQSFETMDAARQGGGFAGLGVFEYEDAYAIDRCFGDKALVTTINLLDTL